MTRTTTAAAQIEIARQYGAIYADFWGHHTALAQIVTEDFPDGARPGVEISRYQLDSLRDLVARLAALTEGYERQQ